jgi:hypothetical protein
MKMKFYPPFKAEGELVAGWGQARLIKHLDGKVELKGGSKEDRLPVHESISLRWQQAVRGRCEVVRSLVEAAPVTMNGRQDLGRLLLHGGLEALSSSAPTRPLNSWNIPIL